MVQKANLIFFVTETTCSEKTAVASTLAWLAEKRGMAFDAYICAENPHTGYWHQEQLYFTSNFYNVYFCSISHHIARFKRAASLFGKVISSKKSGEIADFYQEVFSHLDEPLPTSIVVLPTSVEEKKVLDMEPYCYPEVYHRQFLGVNSDAPNEQLVKLRELGVRNAYTVYCSKDTVRRLEDLGFKVDVIDEIRSGDTYGSVTSRIAERWLKKSKGIGFANHITALKWMPFYLRGQWLTVYEPRDCVEFCKAIAKYANEVGNKIIWGSQAGTLLVDHLITELSRHDLVMSLCYAPEVPSTTIKGEVRLPMDWLSEAKAPWEDEYGEDLLVKKAEEGCIAVCILGYASDLGHHAVLPRILDLMADKRFRMGLAFPSTWWEYEPEILEELFIPDNLGGVFPRLEPLLSSAGVGVATEAKGFLSREMLVSCLKKARETIGSLFGRRLIPIGYYPYQDACPYYCHGTGEPQFDALMEAGMQYCISYKGEGTEPKIVFKSGDFIAVNQQNVHWTAEPLDIITKWEEKLSSEGKPGWIIASIDIPFWGEPIIYLNPKLSTNLAKLYTAMDYVASGGKSKKLFFAKPHEVVRFARILDRKGLLPPPSPLLIPWRDVWMLG
ncbi:MAG: hypothetical protein QXL27_09370 [Candidatus Bathyarchaeia archaeon]